MLEHLVLAVGNGYKHVCTAKDDIPERNLFGRFRDLCSRRYAAPKQRSGGTLCFAFDFDFRLAIRIRASNSPRPSKEQNISIWIGYLKPAQSVVRVFQ